jgi:hypothetical protein
MPFTALQLARGADYTLESYLKTKPVDQITTARPFLEFLMAGKKELEYGNGSEHEPIRVDNGANYQRYFGSDQIVHNERDPARQLEWSYYNFFDGFYFDEDRLKANGIAITDDGSATPTTLEQERLLDESYTALTEGVHDAFAFDCLLDGTQSTKAMPGLDHLVAIDPTAGVVCGHAASNTYWRNNVSLSIAQANLLGQMEAMWRACAQYGGMAPDRIFCGSAFLDDYRAVANDTIDRQIHGAGNMKGGVTMDAGVTRVYYKGVELVWDPTFERLDAALGAITHPWTKRCYFLNSKTIGLRPVKGDWMRRRKVKNLPDRFVHYFGITSKQGMRINKRRANAVLTLD